MEPLPGQELYVALGDSLHSSADLPGVVEEIARNVEEVAEEIRERAPDARVIVVTYPKLLPDDEACPDRITLAPGDYAFVNEVNRGSRRRCATERSPLTPSTSTSTAPVRPMPSAPTSPG